MANSSKEFYQAIRDRLLIEHNKCRSLHGVPRLTTSKKIQDVAQAWANHLAANNFFGHSQNGKYGENIAGGNISEIADGISIKFINGYLSLNVFFFN